MYSVTVDSKKKAFSLPWPLSQHSAVNKAQQKQKIAFQKVKTSRLLDLQNNRTNRNMVDGQKVWRNAALGLSAISLLADMDDQLMTKNSRDLIENKLLTFKTTEAFFALFRNCTFFALIKVRCES